MRLSSCRVPRLKSSRLRDVQIFKRSLFSALSYGRPKQVESDQILIIPCREMDVSDCPLLNVVQAADAHTASRIERIQMGNTRVTERTVKALANDLPGKSYLTQKDKLNGTH